MPNLLKSGALPTGWGIASITITASAASVDFGAIGQSCATPGKQGEHSFLG